MNRADKILGVHILAYVVMIWRPFFLFCDFSSHVDATYQAVAHVLVGGLFAAYYATRPLLRNYGGAAYQVGFNGWMFDLAAQMTAVEVLCAAVKITLKFL